MQWDRWIHFPALFFRIYFLFLCRNTFFITVLDACYSYTSANPIAGESFAINNKKHQRRSHNLNAGAPISFCDSTVGKLLFNTVCHQSSSIQTPCSVSFRYVFYPCNVSVRKNAQFYLTYSLYTHI